MHKSSINSSKSAFPTSFVFLLALCLHFPGIASATAPVGPPQVQRATNCDLQFGAPLQYDMGTETSVAATPAGLILEFRRPPGTEIFYQVGKFDGTKVTWGARQPAGAWGYRPAVAVTKDGYVIEVHATEDFTNRYSRLTSDLYYRIGKIDPDGDHNQSIRWLTESIHWDAGYNASIAINDRGVILGVYEPGSKGDSGLYYRVGLMRYDNTIIWFSGGLEGRKYADQGTNPHIAINSNNDVVEVHESPNSALVHYRRGFVSGGTIHFGESKLYNDWAWEPAVALLDSGDVLEVHAQGYAASFLASRTGKLSLTDPDAVEWSDPVLVHNDFILNPSIAATGNFAVETHSLLYRGPGLAFSVAKPCE